MIIEIPGYEHALELSNVALDFNGTIALDGIVPEAVKHLLNRLAETGLNLFVLTADTRGTVQMACRDLPVEVSTFDGADAGSEKRRIVEKLGAKRTVAFGNGRNDLEMLASAALGVAVIGAEGAFGKLLQVADIVVGDISDGLNLLLDPTRLIASLRS